MEILHESVPILYFCCSLLSAQMSMYHHFTATAHSRRMIQVFEKEVTYKIWIWWHGTFLYELGTPSCCCLHALYLRTKPNILIVIGALTKKLRSIDKSLLQEVMFETHCSYFGLTHFTYDYMHLIAKQANDGANAISIWLQEILAQCVDVSNLWSHLAQERFWHLSIGCSLVTRRSLVGDSVTWLSSRSART